MSREISRRDVLRAAAGAVVIVATGSVMRHRVETGVDLGTRPLDGQLREEGVWNVTVRGFRSNDGTYYEPRFREGPSIEDRILTPEEAKERGYSTTNSFRTKGEKVYGDSGHDGKPVKTEGDGAVIYHGWTKLPGGEYISEDYVEYGRKIDQIATRR